jgi:hypothetical protein
VTAHYQAGSTAFIGELSGARAGRILDYAGWSGDRDLDTGLSAMAALTGLAGTSALQALQDVATAENGNVYVDGAGAVVLQERSARYGQTSAATWGDDLGGGELPYSTDAQVGYDDTRIRNDVAVTRPGGVTATAVDAISIADYGRATLEETPQITSDLEAQDRANYRLAIYKDPHQRIEHISPEPRRDAAGTAWTAVLAAQPGTRWTVKRRPPGAATITLEVHVEASDWTLEPGSRVDLAFQLSPADTQTYWLMGDSVYSVIGTTSIPGY